MIELGRNLAEFAKAVLGVTPFKLQHSIWFMSDNDKKKKVLFDLSDDALYVANGGRIFTRVRSYWNLCILSK